MEHFILESLYRILFTPPGWPPLYHVKDFTALNKSYYTCYLPQLKVIRRTSNFTPDKLLVFFQQATAWKTMLIPVMSFQSFHFMDWSLEFRSFRPLETTEMSHIQLPNGVIAVTKLVSTFWNSPSLYRQKIAMMFAYCWGWFCWKWNTFIYLFIYLLNEPIHTSIKI